MGYALAVILGFVGGIVFSWILVMAATAPDKDKAR